MPELQLESLPFTEAIEFFRKKGYRLSPDSWRDVWAAEHVHAFTVARVTAMDVLEDMRKVVDKALSEGVSLGKFKAELQDLLARKGWMAPRGEEGGAIKPWRLDTVYRTNLQSAYQAGRYKQMLETAPRRPYWMYDAVDDARTRPTHAAHDGKVYRFDHPFWDTWYPPAGFNCRCTVRTLSERDMQRRGLKEQTRGTSLKPDPGFDYNVGIEAWKPDLSKYTPEARKILLSNGVGPPRTMDELQTRLNRMRDGVAQTGIPTSTQPIRLLEDRSTPYRAWARYRTGEIGMSSPVYRRVQDVVKRGAATTADDVDDLKTLVHEFGHLIGHPIDEARYMTDHAYYALCQTVNDLWARHSTGQILRSLDVRYDAREVARLPASHPSGYQEWVQRFRDILKAAGLDDAEQKALAARLNLSMCPEEYSREVWDLLTARKPTLAPSGDFGLFLLDPGRYQWLLWEIRG